MTNVLPDLWFYLEDPESFVLTLKGSTGLRGHGHRVTVQTLGVFGSFSPEISFRALKSEERGLGKMSAPLTGSPASSLSRPGP